jgi:hypothetical protein
MANRVWKFVGGSKSARTSLKAAVSAVVADPDGEKAIFNSETGQLYDVLGNEYPPLVRHQYDKIISVLGILLANYSVGLDIPKHMIPSIIAQCGGGVFNDVKAAAENLVQTLSKVAEVGNDAAGSESSSNEQPVPE